MDFKKGLLALGLAGLLLCPVCANAVPQQTETKTMNNCDANPKEKAGIMKAIDYYLQAGVKGDSAIARKGFAPTATMSWSENGALKSVPIQALYDYFDEKPREGSGEISACSVADDVAIVRLESSSGDARFTDMFTLVKDGDDWKIVSKVYHLKK